MFSKEKEIIDKYFQYINDKFNEKAGILYDIYSQNDRIEIDLLVGENSNKILGIRILDKKKGVVYDLLRNEQDISRRFLSLDAKSLEKEVGIPVISFTIKNENLSLDHDLILYSKKGKLKNPIKYGELKPLDIKNMKEAATFSLDEVLFELQMLA